MGFILENKPFAIRSAELFATIPDPHWVRRYDPANDPRPFWSLEVWVEGELGIEGEARASAEAMHFPIRRWANVAGQAVEWAGPYDEKAGGPYGGFYLGEHDTIGRARLRFAERDGTAFRFEWEGVCNAYLDDEAQRDVPFSAEGWARFTGVTVQGGGADTDESVRGRLAQYLDPGDFVQGPLLRRTYRYSYFRRVKSSHAVFTPLDAREGVAAKK
ncbi:MAG TPA: hypothetical protein VF736_06850 [Pyrinomonadaceae bacterium]|jgi:hypothetical protein